MEKPWLDDRVQHALHWDGYGEAHKSEGRVATVPGVMEGWRTFSLWWKTDEYVFYVDGKETWRASAGGVCQVPLYIKLSDEIGSWAGDIAQARLPDQFIVLSIMYGCTIWWMNHEILIGSHRSTGTRSGWVSLSRALAARIGHQEASVGEDRLERTGHGAGVNGPR
jgi:hypothetical protein